MDNHILVNGMTELGLDYSSTKLRQLYAYKDLLIKWNKVYSLTAIKNEKQILIYHLLDGLSIVKYFQTAHNVLDVGSGMGVPGIILAIMLPSVSVTVLDSNSKKCAFLQQCKIELGLANLNVQLMRIEKYVPEHLFDIITARAFADLALLVNLSQHVLSKSGYFLAMKADKANAELQLINNWQSELIPILVPKLAAKRFLVKIYR